MSSAQIEDIHWPPRSPAELLMRNHAGREHQKLLPERYSLPPSPIKCSSSLIVNSKALDEDIEDIDNDDEEILQLKLQEIQARLKLKKMQKKMKQTSHAGNLIQECKTGTGRTGKIASSRSPLELANQKPSPQLDLQVPVSPVRKKFAQGCQRSPSRVLLGIDKGLRGIDVSLSKMPTQKRADDTTYQRGTGAYLSRYGTTSKTQNAKTGNQNQNSPQKSLSFSERLAAVRRQDRDKEKRDLLIRKSKSLAFNINQDEMRDLKGRANDIVTDPRPAPKFSRDEVMKSFNSTVENIPQIKSTLETHSTSKSIVTSLQKSKLDLSSVRSRKPIKSSTEVSESTDVGDLEVSQFEPYSSQHIKKRIIPHQRLTRLLAGKKIYLIPDLLREIKAPDFSSPDIEEDLVLLAIIASKSEPKVHRSGLNKQDRGKFLAFTLTDLKWELDFFLFDSAFDKFWKMTPGTILAILNPLIMPPPPGKTDTGKFNIMLNSDADTILEIGTARDLGFCKSVKRDGKTCNSWVDQRHSEFCSYHVNSSLLKTHAARMEVNTMNFGKGRYVGKGDLGNKKSSYMSKSGYYGAKSDEKSRYDHATHGQIFIGRKSTINLLDDVDFDPDAFHRGSTKEERMMRRVLSQEKERSLEKKLAMIGSGLGAEYARVRQTGIFPVNSKPSIDSLEMPHDVKTIGLLDGKAKNVTLSPVKRKRSSSIPGPTARGWGRSLAQDLGRMKSGKKLNETPSSKKIRFLTDRGIKEAGRESLNIDVMPENSDDDLDIVET